jgi:hypothetical protein
MFVCGIAAAFGNDPVYIGTELSYGRTTFVPGNTTANRAPGTTYTDRAHGSELRMVAGYRLELI